MLLLLFHLICSSVNFDGSVVPVVSFAAAAAVVVVAIVVVVSVVPAAAVVPLI